MKISIVIPLCNEEQHIEKILKETAKSKLQIILVDDGSVDKSLVKAKKAKTKYRITNLTIIAHKINLGKGSAMKTGAIYAFDKGADCVIFMDADGQHSPEDISLFIEKLKSKKFDVVFGSRNFGYGVPLVRFLGNKFASVFIAFLFKIYVSDVICGFKALTRKAFEKINWESSGYGVETEIVAVTGKKKLKFSEVPVSTIYHDKTKGVTILDAIGIFGDVIRWRLAK